MGQHQQGAGGPLRSRFAPGWLSRLAQTTGPAGQNRTAPPRVRASAVPPGLLDPDRPGRSRLIADLLRDALGTHYMTVRGCDEGRWGPGHYHLWRDTGWRLEEVIRRCLRLFLDGCNRYCGKRFEFQTT